MHPVLQISFACLALHAVLVSAGGIGQCGSANDSVNCNVVGESAVRRFTSRDAESNSETGGERLDSENVNAVESLTSVYDGTESDVGSALKLSHWQHRFPTLRVKDHPEDSESFGSGDNISFVFFCFPAFFIIIALLLGRLTQYRWGKKLKFPGKHKPHLSTSKENAGRSKCVAVPVDHRRTF